MSRKAIYTRGGFVFIFICILVLPIGVSLAQSRNRTAGGAKPKAAGQTDEQVYAQLAGVWSCFYGGKYEDAVKQSAPLMKLTDKRLRWVALEAAHVQARCYWAIGKNNGQAKARKTWNKLEKASTTNATKTRLKIVKALELEAADDSAKLNQAIGILEQILKDNPANMAMPEAAIDLARLYVKAGRLDDAEKTLNFVKEWLSNKDVLKKLELPYVGLTQPYTDAANAALEQLKYLRDAGRKEFEAAEALRIAQKWQEAWKAYQTIVKDFSKTDYAPRSGLAMGHCLVGLKKISQAASHWKKFIESASAGPWRGQAFIALIDLCLEEQLDLAEAGRYAALAGGSMPAALADEKSAVSWRDVEFDIHLRIAMVSFCQGRGEAAAESFESAKKLTGNINIIESLDALTAAAKTGKPIIPQDAQGGGAGEMKAAGSASPSGKAAVALSLGVIHMVAERPNNADTFFDRILGTPARGDQPARAGITGATKAQFAFATFCRGAVFQMRVMHKEAREQLETSVKMYPDGSWHDETLYRLATIIQADAQTKYGKPAEAAADKKTSKKDPKAEQAEKERLANLLKARGEALPYWQELIKRYPKSPRCEQAYYNAGVLMCDVAEAADGKDSEKLWKEASAILGKLCENYPDSPYAGDAYVRQIDIALEKMFDLKTAETISQQAVACAKKLTDEKSNIQQPTQLSPWCAKVYYPDHDSQKLALYNCYLRAGLVDYFRQQYEAAQRLFELAKPFAPSRDFVVVEGDIPTGMENIITVSREKRALTPEEALDGDVKARLVLQLADIYLVAGSYQKSYDLATFVIEELKKTASIPQRSWAHRQRATALSSLRKKIEAKPEYLTAQKLSPSSPWAVECLFLAGTIAHNHEKQPKEAIGIFEEVVKQYPQSELASKAAYFVGVIYEWNSQWSLAKAAYQRVIRDYPESRWAEAAMRYHMKIVDAALAAEKENKTGEK